MQNTYMTEGHRIQTEGVSGATSTESFLEFFSKVDDLWPSRKGEEKNAKNALTSHYANGHGDPCDKWVKIN